LSAGIPADEAGPTETSPSPADSAPTGSALGSEDLELPEEPTAAEVELGLGLGLGTIDAGTTVAAPDLSLPAPSDGSVTVPPIVAAVNPEARAQVAAPEVRLALPASVGKGLRDDDITGFYLGPVP
jgi:hypothetical protein